MSAGAIRSGPVELRRLTALRWYAALTVFFDHLPDFGVTWRPAHLFDLGYTGVGFFFVLSGFVLTWSRKEKQPARSFYLRRVARIYPAMATMAIIAALVFLTHAHLGYRSGWLALLASLLAIQSWFPGSYPAFADNTVAWSLSAEAFFYAVFPWIVRPLAAARARRQVMIAAGALLAGCALTVVLARGGYTGDIAYANPAIRLPEFLLGVVLALRVRAGWRVRVPLWCAVLLVLVMVQAGRYAGGFAHFPTPDFLTLLPFALLIVCAAQQDIAGRPGWLTRNAVVYLGRVSFCFYLVHVLVSTVTIHALGWQHRWSTVGGVVPVVVAFTLSLLAAVALHEFVEKPGERAIKARFVTHTPIHLPHVTLARRRARAKAY